jgi:hypothetical protein
LGTSQITVDQKWFCFVIWFGLALVHFQKNLLLMFDSHLHCLICPSINATHLEDHCSIYENIANFSKA